MTPAQVNAAFEVERARLGRPLTFEEVQALDIKLTGQSPPVYTREHINERDRKPGQRCPICGDSSCPIQASPRATVSHCNAHKQFEYDCIDCDDARRATVPGLNVIITSISHSEQRYDTCGDWYYAPARWDGVKGATKETPHECLYVNVSELPSRREMWLVAIHELIEAFLCECKGITAAEVDQFDKGFSDLIYPEPHPVTGDYDTEWEPGDDPRAPYYRQHQIATGIERILAAEAQVNWLEYEQHVAELSRT